MLKNIFKDFFLECKETKMVTNNYFSSMVLPDFLFLFLFLVILFCIQEDEKEHRKIL